MRLARGAAAALVGMAVLTGCSSGPAPASDTLPSAAPTSAEASETLPPLGPPDFPMPPEAREPTPAAVDAFVRYYLELINRTSESMDTQYLRLLSEGCETCARIALDTERDAAAGYSYNGGQITIKSSAPALVRPPTGELAFIAEQAPLSVVDVNGKPVEGLQFGAIPDLSSGATMRWDPEKLSWILTELTLG